MLSAEEIAAIEHELAHYDKKRAACVDALKIVQQHHGWVSDEHLRDIAALLEMSVHELDAVATFYNLIYRRPVGRHVIHSCDSVSCWLADADAVRTRIRERFGIALGGTSEDGRFTLLPIPCLGACDRAPAMLVDGDLHTELDRDGVAAVLERYP